MFVIPLIFRNIVNKSVKKIYSRTKKNKLFCSSLVF